LTCEVLPDADAVARRAAALIAEAARAAAGARGRFLLATSGGTTPWRMLERLADEDVPWPLVHVFQVDERAVAAADPARTVTRLRVSLLDRVPIPADHVHAMPVEEADLEAAAVRYATTLRRVAGTPAILDLVHLGLGADGHTASLVPGDAALDVDSSDVAVTGAYQGARRMTLTYPVIQRARQVLWLVTGRDKAEALAQLLAADASIPAGRVQTRNARILADAAAASSAR